MAGKKLTAIVELKGKLDASVDAMLKKMSENLKNLKKQISSFSKTKVPDTKLGDLDKTIKNSSQSMTVMGRKLTAIQEGLSFNPASLSLLSDKQQTLGKMIDLSRSKLDALRQKQADFVADGGDIGSDKYEELATEIQKAENALERLNAQQNNFSPKLQQIGVKMGQFSEKTENVAKAIAPVSAGAAALGTASIKTAADFDSAMNQIAATKGISTVDAEMQQFRDQAMKLGGETAFTSAQAAEGLNILSMAGFDTTDAIAMSTDMLNLASAGQISMGNSATYLATTLKGFGMEATDAGKIADRIAKGSSAAATDVDQLGAAFADASATSKSYGLDIDDVGVALLRLADQNVLGSAAGTSLAALEKNLYQASDQGKQMMDQLGVSAYTSEGEAKRLNDVVNELRDSMKGMSEQEQAETLSKIFDIQGADAFRKMIATTDESLAEFNDAMEKSEGAAANMAATQNEGLNGALTSLSSAFDNAKIKIGSFFTGPLEKGADWLTGLIQKFNNASDSTHQFAAYGLAGIAAAAPALLGVSKLTGGISKFIDKAGRANTVTGKLAGGLGKVFNRKKSKGIDLPAVPGDGGASTQMSQATSAASAGTSKIGSLFQGLGNGISTAFQGISKGISTALQGASAAISNLNPMGAASFAIVIGTLTLALIGLAKCRNDVLPFLQGLSDIFTSMVGGVLDAVASSLVKLSDVALVLGQALAATAPFVESLGTAIATIASGLGEGIATIAEGVGGGIARIISAIGPAAPQIAAAIATIITAFSNGAPQIAAAVSTIITACQPIVSDLTSLFETLLTQIGPIIQSIGDLIGDIGTAIQDVLTGVSGVIDSIGGAIQAFFDGISGVIDSVGDAALNAGKGFEKFANGCKIIADLGGLDLVGTLTGIAGALLAFAPSVGNMERLGTGISQMAAGFSTLSGSFSSIESALSSLPGLLTQVSASVDQITSINDKLAPAVAGVQASLSSMQSAFTMVYAAILNVVTTAMNRLPQITTTAMTQVLTITTTMLSGLSAIVTSMMAGVVAAFQSAMASAVATVSAGMAAIRGMMSVSIQGPRLAVPHVSVSGSFSLNPPSAPSFSVSYYKEGGILSGAQLFGMMGNTGLVGGEAGPEAVLPLSTLWDRMDTILSNAMKAAVGYRENSGRMINADPAVISPEITPASGGFVVNFAPVINLGTAGESAGSTESSITAALSRAKDDLMDELEDLFRERMERSYA